MKVVEINESTRLPLGWTVSIAALGAAQLIGFSAWLTTMHAEVAQAKIERAELKLEVKEDRREAVNFYRRIDLRLQRLEIHLGVKDALKDPLEQ